MTRYILGILLFLASAACAMAQMEHVPATHPVYEFLDRLHARGTIRGFSRAVLPLERREVTALLRAVADKGTLLSETESALLARYRDEFVAEDDGTQTSTVFFRDGFEGMFSDVEKFLYTWANADRSTTFFMEFIGTLDARARRGDGASADVVLGQVGGRFRGTAGSTMGYGLQATNGTAFGDSAFARSDASLRTNSNFGDWGNEYFDFSEAYVSAGWSWGDASLGRERVLLGNGYGGRVILGSGAPVFDALRLNVRAGDFRFSFMHGFLLGEKEYVQTIRPFYESKYFVYHRAEADLFDAVRFGVFETVVYSERQVDAGYLIPVNFFKSAEHAGGDRDNPLLGFDLQTLRLPAAFEAYGSWSIDDIDISKFGSDWWGNKFIWQGGVVTHAVGDTRLGLEYTRIEPYVYSHTMRNNDYTNKGEALGLELPPNSDEWHAHAAWWHGSSFMLAGSFRSRRHGRNEYSTDGTLLVNHGGNIADRFDFMRDNPTAPFLGGSLETQRILTASARWEPARNFVFDLTWRHVRSSSAPESTNFLSLLMEIVY